MRYVNKLSGKALIAVVTARAEKLSQAIVVKAFGDELIPTEAELAQSGGRSYEPASALLAKIRLKMEDFKLQRKRKGFKKNSGERIARKNAYKLIE